jgi:L-ribulose-5-phosphate 3-epimerase
MTNDVGIVLGRLSPPVPGRLQAFPWASWREEFGRARDLGFQSIEWVFEADRHAENPLWHEAGLAAIASAIERSGVPVVSVCADYFMARPFFRVSEPDRAESVATLDRLIRHGARLGVRTILLPVLEVAEIRSSRDEAALLASLRPLLDSSAEAGVSIALETELPASEYLALIDAAAHPALAAYYDVGNATARGYDVAADVRRLGRRLAGIHLKDRRRGGPSVRLGTGDAAFPACFDALAEVGYAGPFILQTASDEDYLGAAGAQLALVRDLMRVASARVPGPPRW